MVLMIANLHVSAQDYVQFDVNYDQFKCSPVVVYINNYSSFSYYTGVVTYNWYLDGSLFSSVQYPDTVTVYAGSHEIRLQALDTLGGLIGENWQFVNINGFTHQFYTDPADAVVPGQPVNFFTNDQHQWAIWKLHNGIILKYNWVKYVYTTPGVYPVKLTVGGDCGIDSVIQYITVDTSAIPFTEIMVTNTYLCPNDEFILTASKAFKNEWIIEGNTFEAKELYYAFADTGIHTVVLKNTNEYGNAGFDTAFIEVRSDIPVSAYFYPSFNNATCPNNELNFEAESAGTFEWDFGDGSTGFGKRVHNTFVDTGTYNVTLYATNGCGTQDTMTQPIPIFYDINNYAPYPNFYFSNIDDSWQESISVCQNEEVRVKYDNGSQEGVTYTWLIDSMEYTQEEVSHFFTKPGSYEIKLTSRNNCNSEQYTSKWVYVDSTITPNVNIGFAPTAICPGELVYFFDDNNKFREDGPARMTYSIDFGDGNTISNITKPTDPNMNFLAVHPYVVPGTYTFTVTATNTCGNTFTYIDSVLVSDDPDRIPFYYTHNTSTDDKMEGEFEDWSVIPNKQYTTFNVNVGLQNWNSCGPMDSLVYVYFWYGYFDMNDPNLGPPNGFVQVKAPGTAIAYVPFNVVQPSVGLATVWYCNKDYLDKDPQVSAIPYDSTLMQQVQSYPTYPGTNFVVPQNLVLDGMQWSMEQSCLCKPPADKIKGEWNYQTDGGYYHLLNIYEDSLGSLFYDASAGPDPWDGNRTLFQNGTVNMMNDSTIELMASNGDCFEIGMYRFTAINDNLTLTFLYDNCISRIPFLVQKPFVRTQYDNYDSEIKGGCPGDTIGFRIIGGSSYEWHIRGTTSTLPYTYYVYPDTGVFEEFVVATNLCGRSDTIYTKVLISQNNFPDVSWNINKWNAKRFEPILFESYVRSDFNNHIFLWDFGDGTSSTLRNPTHFYTVEGEYTITLTVENGCGQFSEQRTIYITKETAVCEAKFMYTSTGDTVFFTNKALGSISSYYWEFGDGKVSTKPNPVNIYPSEGIYLVTLTVYDSINDCSNQIRKQIMVGNIGCIANFNFTVNSVTKSVSFNNLSSGDITEYYWSFGDGKFSTDINPINTYLREGTYKVCLTTHDSTTNCMSEACKIVTIGNPYIVADFSYYIDPQTDMVGFSDISTGTITNWYWDFGDGNWDTIPEPEHAYANSGEYTVCLSVFDSYNGAFADVCKTIMVITDTSLVSTKADFAYFVNPVTRKVDFIDKSTGAITNWYWTFGDGTYQAGKNVSKTYTAPGMYNVCLVVFNSGTGERSEICKTIQVGVISCNVNANFGYFINPTTKQVTFSDKTTGIVQKYFWDFGNGKTSTLKNPIHTYQNSGFYLVSLAVRDTINGCTDYFADFIQVGAADCKSDFNFTITDLGTNTVKFTNTATGNIGTYFWYFNDGFYSTEANPAHSYGSGGLYSVSLTVADNTGLCFDYRVKDVQVGTIDCNADFTYYIDPATNEAYFTNKVLGASTSMYWMFGDGNHFIGQDPVHQYYAPGYYKVSLNTFNSANGCMDYDEKVVLIGSPGNDVDASFVFTSNLATREVKFSNQSNGENLKYSWSFGDGTTSILANPVKTYATGGYKFVCLTATDSISKMQNTMCEMIQVSADAQSNCLSRFNYDIDTTTKTVKFKDKSYGSPNQFNWDFGDGTTSTVQNPTKVYAANGYYLVGLKTKNSTGCGSYEYEIVNVNAGTGIQAMFTYYVDTTTKGKPGGKPVDMIGVRHGGGSSLSWNYGDGSVKTSKVINETTLRPSHIYENPGIYNACLIISDPIINQSDTFCNLISIPYEITATESICEGSSYNFMGTMLTTAGNYVDTTTSVIGVDSIVYLTLSVNSIPDKPTASLSGSTLTSSTGTTYQWYLNGSIINGATNQTYTPTVSGNYTVIITNSSGCNSVASDPVNVVISGIQDINPFSLKVYPNPLQTHTRIEYYLTNTQQIKIALYDVAGNLIETIVNTYKPAGEHYVLWKNPGLASGIYYLVVTSDFEKSTTKLVIQK
ncbi:MAG: hypothetical protein A2W99_09695 [Bacteroidetes bacterium GWF2_33_16]|nr:MAG: hypothetical protein A2X00_06605 [Bacteroidetes bacterium GWE2_32_14]OFY07265.1 MAG: hypothetical protein A2W99_09695 [Bacteroidetes bacterium GWF2_33_16]